jgi:hypothetical protein
MKLNMFEVIFAICFTVQNVSEPLLILTERFMAHIAQVPSLRNFMKKCGDKKARPTEREQHWYCLQNFVRISFLV